MPKSVRIPGRGVYDFPDSMSDSQILEYVEDEERRRRQQKVSYGTMTDALMGAARGATDTITGSAASLAETFGLDSIADMARSGQRAGRERLFGFGPEMPDNDASRIGEMVGSTGAYLGAGLAATGAAALAGPATLGGLALTTLAPSVTTGLLGVGSGLEEQRRRQLQAASEGREITPEEKLKADWMGAALGATEALPFNRLLGPVGKLLGQRGQAGLEAAEALMKRQGLKGLGANMGAQFLEEGAQEVGSQVGQNLAEQFYNPERGAWEGAVEAGLAGGIMGAGFGGAGHYANRWLAKHQYGKEMQQRLDELDKLQAAMDELSPQQQQMGLFDQQQPGEGRNLGEFGDELLPGRGEAPEAPAVPAPEAPKPRVPRITPEEFEAKSPLLEAAEARVGDAVLSFESPLDRAAWLGSRPNVEYDARKPFLSLAADLMGGTEGEAQGLGRKLHNAIDKTAKGVQGPMNVPRMIETGGPAPIFRPAPAYVPPVQTVPGRPAQQQTLGLTGAVQTAPVPVPPVPESKTIGTRVSDTLTRTAADLGMNRKVGSDLIGGFHAGDAAAEEVASAALELTGKAHPQQVYMALPYSSSGLVTWLRANNWINPKEWSLLQRAARGSQHMENLRQRHPELADDQIEPMAINNVLRDRAAGYPLPQGLEKVYLRTMGALESVGTALRGSGINTMDDAIARLRPAPAPAAPPAPAPAAPPPDTKFFEEQQAHINELLKQYKPEQSLVANLMRDIRTTQGEQAEGLYRRGAKTIEILMQQRQKGEPANAWQQRVTELFNHEFIHYLRDAGVFTPGQWNTLVRKAKKRGHVAEAADLYKDQPGYTNDTFEEEGVSSLFGDTAKNVAPDGFVRRMWDRVSNVFSRVGNAFAGRGWQTADDLFKAIRSGEVAQQTPQAVLQQQQAAAAQAAAQQLASGPVMTEGQARARSQRGQAQAQPATPSPLEQAMTEAMAQAPPRTPEELYAVMRKPNMEPLFTADDPETVEHPSEISTRNASAVKQRFKGEVLESALGPEILTTGYESGSRDPEKFLTNVLAARSGLNFHDISEAEVHANPHAAAQKMIGRMKDNLLWLHKKFLEEHGEDVVNRAKLWYDGANRIARHFAKEFGTNVDQAAGVLAVFSPQKDWFQNVDMARRAMDFWKKRNRMKWDESMDKAFLEPKKKRTKNPSTWAMGERLDSDENGNPKEPYYVPMYERIRGKRFSEITDPEERALWFRLHDEAKNPRAYPVVTPEGDFAKWALNDDKSRAEMAWSSFDRIANAFSMLEDGSRPNISNRLGNEHKVRNFYDNILVPNSKRGHVTMDTHAVAAALVRALSGESQEVKKNFGGTGTSGSKYTGEYGTYFLTAQAYRDAAKELGLLPREMQSITWEAVRGLFTDKFKGATTKDAAGNKHLVNVEAVDKFWQNVVDGTLTTEEAREKAYERGNRIDLPEWAGKRGRHRGSNASQGAPADKGMVLPADLGGAGPEEGAGRGDRGKPPVALPASELPVGAGQRDGGVSAGDVRYALPRRSVHVGLKLGHGSPLHKQYGSDVAIPFETADEIYDDVAKKVGVKIHKRHHSMGTWEGVSEPSTRLTVSGSANDIQDFMHALSYGLQQTAVIGARKREGGNGYVVDLVQRGGKDMANGEYAMRMAERIREVVLNDPEFQNADGSNRFEAPASWGGMKSLVAGASAIDREGRPALRYYNDDGKFTQEQLDGLASILRDKMGDEFNNLDIDVEHGDVDFESAYNDWNENPNGESFINQIVQRDGGVLRSFLDNHVRPRVDAAVAGRSADEARGRGAAEAGAAAAPGEVRYALSRKERKPPQPPPVSDQILTSAAAIRAGGNPDISRFSPAEQAQVKKIASSKVDPARLLKIDPDEYITTRKLDISNHLKERLRNEIRLAADAGGWAPHEEKGFNEIKAQAAKMLGDDNILDVKALKEGGTLNPAVRLAYSILSQDIERQIHTRTNELAKNAPGMSQSQQMQAQRELDILGNDLQKLYNVLIPARTQDGRNLVYHRIMAQGGLGREYWNAHVKRRLNLPPNVSLPDEVFKPLNEAITDAQNAEQELKEAQDQLNGAQTSGDPSAQTKAKERVQRAKDGLMNGRKKLAKEVARHDKMTKPESLMALWKANLLTNPAARFADAFSNAGFAALERLASVPAAWVDTALGKKTGRRTALSHFNAQQMGEAYKGFGEGLKKSKGKLGEVMRGEVMPDQKTQGKLEMHREFDLGKGRVAQIAKRYVEGVHGVQQATDLPFRESAYRHGIAELSQLQAINEHKAGKLPAGMNMAQRTQQLIENPTETIQNEADAISEFMSFAEDNWGNRGFSAFKKAAESQPGGKFVGGVMDFVFPFVRVPTNVFRRVLEYSPVGLTRGIAKVAMHAKQIKDKSLSDKDQRLYSQLVGRGLVGSALMLLGYRAAEKGLMSGIRDQDDQEGKLADEAAGRPPGAIKVGNEWVQVGRVSPGGNLLISGATMFQEGHKRKDPAGMLGAGAGVLGKTVLDMPFMMGVDMIKDALESPGDKGAAYVKRQIGSVVPAGIARLAATVDPIQRDLRDEGWYSDLLSRTPGASKSLPARQDVLGRELKQPGYGPLGPLLDPFRSRTGYDDPVSQAIVNDKLRLSRLKKGETESKDVYNRRAQLAGEMTYRALQDALQSPEYQMAQTAEERMEVLKDARDAANRTLGSMTTRDPIYKESKEEEQRRMIDQYLEEVRSVAPLQ